MSIAKKLAVRSRAPFLLMPHLVARRKDATDPIIMAGSNNTIVHVILCSIRSLTSIPRVIEYPKSKVKMDDRNFTYCSGNERSSPYFSSKKALTLGSTRVTVSPNRFSTGSPGIILGRIKVMVRTRNNITAKRTTFLMNQARLDPKLLVPCFILN